MGKQQVIALLIAIGLVLSFYLGCDNISQSQKEINKSREKTLVATDIQNLLNEARAELTTSSRSEIALLESMVQDAQSDSLNHIAALEQLSAAWFQFGLAAIAGHYAWEIADKTQQADSWEIAGTTFVLCLQQTAASKIRQFCSTKAVQAFENAIAEEPVNVTHRINLALSYVEEPPKENPMQGILMLRDLAEKNPENPAVLFQLGRLAVMTGQYAKAVERLEQAYAIDQDDKRIICLLAESYGQIGDSVRSDEFAKKCNN